MKRERRGPFLVVTVILVSAALFVLCSANVRAGRSSLDDTQASIRTFTQVLDVVQANYADPVDADKLIYEGAIPGMLRVLDPHSHFFDARQWALNTEERRGNYYGVGMAVVTRGDRTVVMSPYVGSPAYKAGIRPGDMIEKINDVSVADKTSTEVSDLLRGARDTTIEITVSREGYDDPLVFTVTRDEISHHSIDMAYDIRPGIGYIRFPGPFNETSDSELAEAMNQLNAASLDGLILDMRGNPGGLLGEAIAVSDRLLDKNQLIVSHRGRSSPERRYYAVRGNHGSNMPLVILVNNNSASATEIVSGAVQDHDRGVIVGESSFGKGLVQVLDPLSENTGMALTTARYYTPSGRLIQRDYKSVSLYSYHYERKVPDHPTEIRLTDSGRQVTGGGGITPDIIVKEPDYNRFQRTLFRDDVLYPFETSVGGLTRNYFATRPTITRDFQADDAILADFRNYLTAHDVRYVESDIAVNHDWIKRKIKEEVFIYTYGQQEGYKVELEADPQLLAAIDAVPQARALYEKARKIVAQRAGASLARP